MPRALAISHKTRFLPAMISDAPVLQQTAEPAESAAAPSWLSRYARPTLGLLLPLTVALGWELLVWFGWSNGRLVPPPSRVFATIIDLARSGELVRHIAATLWRVGLGFAFGVVTGTLLGAISGYWSLARRLLDPTVQALRAIPSIAWVPLFILWLGIFETSKIALIAVGVFFPVYLGVMGVILMVDRKIVEVGRTFRLSGPAMIRRILLPAVLPAYVVSLRVGLGLGWMFVVAAELIGASEGLGYLLLDGQQLGKPAQILAAIVIFAILGKLTDWLIEIAAAPLLRRQDAFGGTVGASGDAGDRPGQQDLSQRRAGAGALLRRDQARRDRRHHRRLGLRQVHAAARHRRPRPRKLGRGDARQRGDRRAACQDRHHLPGAAAAALAQRRRQYRLWSCRWARD